MASLCQDKAADMPTVQDMPDGFKAVDTRYGPEFRCSPCDVPVLP
jgi:hypothetical protein